MTRPTVSNLDKRLTVVEEVFEERWLETINRIKRLEAVLVGSAGAIITLLLVQIINV
jgi:hypothetical protein